MNEKNRYDTRLTLVLDTRGDDDIAACRKIQDMTGMVVTHFGYWEDKSLYVQIDGEIDAASYLDGRAALRKIKQLVNEFYPSAHACSVEESVRERTPIITEDDD